MKEFIIKVSEPHKLASSDKLSRWIKDKLGVPVINTNICKAYGCWSALRVGYKG